MKGAHDHGRERERETAPDLKEALKKAKSPEDLLKALEAEGFDMQELSLDDLEQVAGGATYTMDGYEWTEPEFNSFFMELTRQVGFDVAYQFLKIKTGFVWENEVHPDVVTTNAYRVSTDEEKMELVLYDFWRIVGKGGGY